jgi:cell division protease FtsH
VKNKSVIRRKIGNVENAYFAEVVFNYGSPIKYPYAKGYYMALTPCKIMLDENGKENIEKDTKYTQEELLFEINEPSENAINIALDVADIYVETLMMQIEQQKIDEKRKENDMKYRLENAKLDLEYGLDETKEGFNMKWNKRDGNNDNNNTDTNNTDSSRIGIEKSKYYTKPSTVTFDDIAGMIEVKREVMEAISLFRDREKYEKMGVTSKMNNILLSGAPGAGKTLMVKAMSNELGIPLFQSSGEFAEKYVGVAAKNVKTLFEDARKYAPSIIFIDEAEQVGRKRTGESNNSERESATAELLNQLDGFDTTDDVIVILATNLPDTLDEALLRRMSKKIHVRNPDYETRKGILEINARNKPMDENCDLGKIARNLSGFNGGTIANIMNQAGMLAVRKGLDKITQAELEEAFEVETCGIKSETKKLNEKDKTIVAHHECGHAVSAYLLKSEKIQKISILPRTGSTLGFVFYANEDTDDKFLSTREELLNDIVVSLSGRASEELFFNEVTGGCSNDLEKATRIAENMVTRMGMSDTFGLISMNPQDSFMREKIVREVNSILNECYKKAKELLEENRKLIEALVEELLYKEEMNLEDFETIYNKMNILE